MTQDDATPPCAFRFFDNREKYPLFVTSCCEKWAIADSVSGELNLIAATPPT